MGICESTHSDSSIDAIDKRNNISQLSKVEQSILESNVDISLSNILKTLLKRRSSIKIKQ